MPRKESAARNIVPPPVPTPDGNLRAVPAFPVSEEAHARYLAEKDARAQAETEMKELRKKLKDELVEDHEIIFDDESPLPPIFIERNEATVDPTADQLQKDDLIFDDEAPAIETPEQRISSEMAQHHAMAAAAEYRTLKIRHKLAAGTMLNDDDAWPALHELRKDQIDLETALEDAWKLPEHILHDPEATAERRALVDAISDVQTTLVMVRERVQTETAPLEEQAAYTEVRQVAMETVAPVHHQIAEIQEATEQHLLSDAERAQAEHWLQQQAHNAERELQELIASIDTSWEDPTPEAVVQEIVKTEEATNVSAEAHAAMHTLMRVKEDERMAQEHVPAIPLPKSAMSTMWDDVTAAIDDARGTLKKAYTSTKEVTTQDAKRIMTQLAKQSKNLSKRLERLQLQKKPNEADRKEMETIAASKHLIEDITHDLHGLSAFEQNDRLLTNRASKQEIALAEIAEQQAKWLPAIRKQYGMEPEEIIARGKRGWAQKFIGKLTADALTQWQTLEDRRQEIMQEQSPALTHRNVITGEARGKSRVLRGEAATMEAERISQRHQATTWRESQGRSKAETEVDFFEGSLEHPSEQIAVHHPSVIADLEEAAESGLDDAHDLYEEIRRHPFTEFLSFSPQEYVRQRGLERELMARLDAVKGLGRFRVKRQLAAVRSVLQGWQNQLVEYGITKDAQTARQTQSRKKK